MSTHDTSIVSVSLPSTSRDLGISAVFTSWILVIYLVFSASLLLTPGSLGDTLGHRRMLVAGFLLFTIGTLRSRFARDIPPLLLLRQAVQGIGVRIILAISPALVSMLLPASRKGAAFGLIGASVSVALIAGFLIGGYVTGFLNWHWIFSQNVPGGIAAIVFAIHFIPYQTLLKRGRFDDPAAILLSPFPMRLVVQLGHMGAVRSSSVVSPQHSWRFSPDGSCLPLS